MAFEVYDKQNWRISREIASILAQSKNLAMLHWRMKRNFSQERAAQECKIYMHIWAGLENQRLIPTHQEADAVADTIGFPKWFLFPQLRVRIDKKLFIRTTSRLTFIRLVRGLSMEDLSKMAGVPRLFISELERGIEANTNFMDYVLKIVEALNKMEGFLKVAENDIVGDVPDDFFINHESLQDAVQKELKLYDQWY